MPGDGSGRWVSATPPPSTPRYSANSSITWFWPADALIVWGMRDSAFKPGSTVRRVRAAFDDQVVVELLHAIHFIQQDAPEEIARAIIGRFG